MGLLDFIFGGGQKADLDDIQAYVEKKLDEAADWRAQQWAELEVRRQHARELNDQLLHLRDQVGRHDP